MIGPHDCAVCEDTALKGLPALEAMTLRRFIVCRDCGNKRCPKASWHENACTRSNEPGQTGSFYGPKNSWPTKSAEPRK